MKKVVCLIAVLALTAGVYAQNVTITAAVDGDTITLGYDATGSAAMPVGFSFIVDAGTASLAAAGDVGLADSFFDVFIDFAADDPAAYQAGANPTTGVLAGAHPIAKADGAGAATFPATVFAVSAAELANVATIPATGTICTLKMTGTGTVCFSEDTLRGGVVDTTGAAMTVTLPECVNVPAGPTECFPNTADFASQYADWVALGKPDCWCNEFSPRQCHGDADGITSGSPFNYRIYNGDLTKLFNNWKAKAATVGADFCADVTHKSSGSPFNYRVYNDDLSRVFANWKKKDTTVPANCPLTDAANNTYVAP